MGICVGVTRERIVVNGVTEMVGKLCTRTVRTRVPACEAALDGVCGLKHGKRVAVYVENVEFVCIGSTAHYLGINACYLNVVGVGRPVSVKNKLIVAAEYVRRVLSAVTLCGIGSVVPAVEVEAVVLKAIGHRHSITVCKILGNVSAADNTALVGDLVGGNLNGGPLGVSVICRSYVYGVYALGVELKLSGGSALNYEA